MIQINKRKFLTELGKLLTFMFEEDRQRALTIYENMFDEAEDDTALMQILGSPTKQAVVVARAYNAKERRLAVTSQSGEGDADVENAEEPEFVNAINGMRDAAVKQGIIPDILTGQFSVFDEQEDIPADAPDSEAAEPEEVPLAEDVPPAEEAVEPSEEPLPEDIVAEEQEPALAEGEQAFEELPVFSLEVSEEERAEPPEEPAEEESKLTEDSAQLPVAETEESDEPEEEPQPEESAASNQENPPEEAPEEFDNFQMDLGPIPEEKRVQPEDIDELMATFRGNGRGEPPIPAFKPAAQTTLAEFEETPVEEATPWKQASEEDEAPSGHLVVPRVILYLLLAVPVTAAGVLILLVPTLLFLVMAAAFGVAAFRVATLAFNSFAVFADIVVVLGAALVLLSVAIFLFWIFVSFIGGAIAGLINLAIRIGGKICYKEEKKA